MEKWRIDPDNAQRLRCLIKEQLQEKMDNPGIGCHRDVRGTFYTFLVGEASLVEVRTYVDQHMTPTLCHLRLLDEPGASTAHITVDGEAVLYWGRRDGLYQMMLTTIETHLSSGVILPKLHMPYGFVQDGTVVAIWFTRLLKSYIPGALRVATAEFSLQGLDLPALLLRNGGVTKTYMQKYWQLMDSGHIIELDERVAHPNALWFVSSNVGWPHLTFVGDGSETPRLPADMPYLLRSANDPADSDLPHTRQEVAEYLQANKPPENLSEMFASHL